MPASKLMINNCQIKSAEKFREVCKALDVLEKEMFIGSGRIGFRNVFICPDIDLLQFAESTDPMEALMGRLCIGLHLKRYGKHADKKYKRWVKKYHG